MAYAQRLILGAAKPRRVLWGVFAAFLVVAGFACDGTTEVGHHLFLILGGVAIGYGAAKDRQQ